MLVGFDLGTRDFPDRGWIATFLPSFDLGLLAFDPTEEARLMRPHVNRVGQHWPALHADDLLMREGPDLIPNRLEHGLPRRRVPAVPGGVRCDRAFDRCHDEFEIELAAQLGVALDVRRRSRFPVLARPVLVAVRLPTIRPGRRMRTTRIANRVGRIGLEKDSPFPRPSSAKRLAGA